MKRPIILSAQGQTETGQNAKGRIRMVTVRTTAGVGVVSLADPETNEVLIDRLAGTVFKELQFDTEGLEAPRGFRVDVLTGTNVMASVYMAG